MTNPEQKLSFWQKVGKALTEQLETTISAFVTGVFFTSLFFIVIALPDKDKTIEEYKTLMDIYRGERDFWKKKYDEAPQDIDRSFEMLKKYRDSEKSVLIEKDRSAEIIEEQNRKLLELERQNKIIK